VRSRVPLALVAFLAAGCAAPEVPLTRTVDHVDDYHGTKVPDPYRWLEDAADPEVRAWVDAQNRSTEAFLSRVPDRDALRARLTELWDFERFGVPRKEGGRLFYTRNDGLQDQAVLWVQGSADAAPRVLLDPNGLSTDGTVALVQWEPSRDGALLAYGLSSAGSDWVEWRVREVDSGKDRPDHLKWSKFSGLSWAKDDSGFWYNRYDAPREGEEYEGVLENQKLCFHRLGEPQEKDAVVYARPDHPRWGFGAQATEDGRWLVVHVWEGSQPENRIYLADLANPAATVKPLLDEGDAGWEFVDNEGGTLLFKTDKGAPKGRVVAVDAADATPGRWRTIVPEAEETLEAAVAVGGRLVGTYLKDARSEVRVFGLDGKPERTLALPGTGFAGFFTGKRSDPEAFFVYTDFFTPSAILRCEPATGKVEARFTPRVPFDPAEFEVEQVFYSSADGTRVPMFVARRKGLAKDGERPVLLYAYGGFRIPLSPFFSVSNLVWMERGGVLAVANIRGGGEYGEAWHEAALGPNRPRAFEDFCAAGEWLCGNGWTKPSRLAIAGGSNGGLLVGACMTRRPELFGAALPSMGVLDMLRYHKFTIGWAWSHEYGTSDDPEAFRWLLGYSPYHNLRKGTRYPPTLVCTADTDDRVVPAHSYKFAAALQAAQEGGAPAFLRVDVRSGHGMGAPTRMQIARAADQLAFLVGVLR